MQVSVPDRGEEKGSFRGHNDPLSNTMPGVSCCQAFGVQVMFLSISTNTPTTL